MAIPRTYATAGAFTPQREIAPKQEQEQSLDIGLGL
jgi:hypothetical protein